MRYDCEVIVATADGRYFRWESVVAAADLSRAVEVTRAHADNLKSECRIVSLMLDEIQPGSPLDSVSAPAEGVYAINDFSEVQLPQAMRFR